MKVTIGKLFRKTESVILSVIDKYRAKILGLVTVGVVAALAISLLTPLDYQKPKVAKEFAKTSVMITNADQTSGGSGVILRSNLAFSEILTNKHVCSLTKGGGYIIKDERSYLVHAIKKYPNHDLCLVKVFGNLQVNTKVADSTPEDFEPAFISGHPGLLPHVLTMGNFSGFRIIQLVVGMQKCTDDTPEEYLIYCLFFGAVPIVQSFDSQLVTGTILPGSSGSGVFNKNGEIAGLVFAGKGKGMGYAYIVPHHFVVDFLRTEKNDPYVEVLKFEYDNMLESIFNTQTYCDIKDLRFKNYCSSRQDYLIWKK
jgi:hypothetical protein